ncbi:hypothetical protein [Anaerovibrio sp.]|uniref:hypothetical protein n=1 Tax=Anaerovibrio sp. TaxID=1872532 RepID=UPI0025F33F02|nr:hypothetical protein [Anaerovibrio sp.]
MTVGRPLNGKGAVWLCITDISSVYFIGKRIAVFLRQFFFMAGSSYPDGEFSNEMVCVGDTGRCHRLAW